MGQKRMGQELGLAEEPRGRLEADILAGDGGDAWAIISVRLCVVLVHPAIEALDVEVAPVVAAGQVVEHLVGPVVVVDVLDDLPAAEHPHPAEEDVRAAEGAELFGVVRVVIDELEAELDCWGPSSRRSPGPS